jgi:two-component system response regulator FixJ
MIAQRFGPPVFLSPAANTARLGARVRAPKGENAMAGQRSRPGRAETARNPSQIDLSYIKALATVSWSLRPGPPFPYQPAAGEIMDKHRQLSVDRSVIVVVDDDAAVRNSLKFSLEIEGFIVCAYSAGADLLHADLTGCACLIVDQYMPGMNGLDVVAKLRACRVSTPAILITSHPNAAVISRAADAGVPIVEKPFLGNALIDSIRAVVLAQPV